MLVTSILNLGAQDTCPECPGSMLVLEVLVPYASISVTPYDLWQWSGRVLSPHLLVPSYMLLLPGRPLCSLFP